jgi:Mn2+/Fe2+ NRAMP family transporter
VVWPLLLMLSGAASVAATSFAGAVMCRLVRIDAAGWQRAVLVRTVSLVPAVFVAIAGRAASSALTTALNVVQCLALPFVLMPLTQLAVRAMLLAAARDELGARAARLLRHYRARKLMFVLAVLPI